MATPNRRGLVSIVFVGFVVFVLSGIGAAMAWVPSPIEAAGEAVIDNQTPVQPLIDPARGHRCAECGIVESSRMVVRYAKGVDAEATLPMAVSARSNRSALAFRVSEVTVRMRDGTSRLFEDENPLNWRPGDRMIVIDGLSAAAR